MKNKTRITLAACFVSYAVQAIICGFPPLLFLTFGKEFGISLGKVTFLITVNFAVQLLTDLAAAVFVDKIGYRTALLLAHGLSSAGLISLAVLPSVLPDAYTALIIATVISAVGAGLLEVLVSPVADACPGDNKENTMSLLHSFFCWGYVAAVLVSTVCFTVFGIENWRYIALAWAVIPLVNGIAFAFAPLYPVTPDGEKGMSIRELAKKGEFYLFLLMMLAAGASELAVSQWASVFAEKGLGVTKTVGDLAGPMAFALFQGISRAMYGGKLGKKIRLTTYMLVSALLCAASYAVIVFVPNAVAGLAGCAVCGFSVGIFWPGTYSTASATMKRGGTVLFAMLALAGDLGCAAGPTLTGLVSGASDDNLRTGLMCASVFPLIFIAGTLYLIRKKKQRTGDGAACRKDD